MPAFIALVVKRQQQCVPHSLVLAPFFFLVLGYIYQLHFASSLTSGKRANALLYYSRSLMNNQEWYATQNVCPHKRALVLSEGIVGSRDGILKVACPLHKNNFDLKRCVCACVRVCSIFTLMLLYQEVESSALSQRPERVFKTRNVRIVRHHLVGELGRFVRTASRWSSLSWHFFCLFSSAGPLRAWVTSTNYVGVSHVYNL